jgi:hypothetical protein
LPSGLGGSLDGFREQSPLRVRNEQEVLAVDDFSFWIRGQPSLYSIEGVGVDRLMVKLTAARDRWAKVSGALPIITLCYKVG